MDQNLKPFVINKISIDEEFFDLMDFGNGIYFVDYSHLPRGIDVNLDNGVICPCEGKNREVITTIEGLKEVVGEIILKIVMSFYDGSSFLLPDLSIDDSEKKLLIEQVVFDILFDKYLSESERMTGNSYSYYVSAKSCTDIDQKTYLSHSINERLRRGMEKYRNMVQYSRLKEQIEWLGVDPDKYARYYTSGKKPKIVWDCVYYNSCLRLTSRQYRRQLTRSNRNYPYREIIEDLNEYYNFVNRLLPVEQESPKKYFNMSMDYYVLESYKRVDFMFKIIDVLRKMGIKEIDREHFLVHRFHPGVLVPYEKNFRIQFTAKCKYYRPLFLIEEAIHKQILEDDNLDDSIYGIKLVRYQIIRAKAYELFKYHAEFDSSNYDDIKHFIQQSYNMRKYHESNDIWKVIKNVNWKEKNSDEKSQLKKLINNLLSMNQSFFWDSPDREYTVPQNVQ